MVDVDKISGNNIILDNNPVNDLASKEESKVLSDTVDQLRDEADTAVIIDKPKAESKINPNPTLDVSDDSTEALSLEDETKTEEVIVKNNSPGNPEKVINEQKTVFTQKEQSGELLKYDTAAISVAKQYVDKQFEEENPIQNILTDNEVLTIPEGEAANIIMQSAEILGEIDTAAETEADTKMSFVEDVDGLFKDGIPEVNTTEVPKAQVTEAPVDTTSLDLKGIAEETEVTVITEEPVLAAPTEKKLPPAPKAINIESVIDSKSVTLNEKKVNTMLEVSDEILEVAKIEDANKPADAEDSGMSELEIKIQEENKMKERQNTRLRNEIDSINGEISVAEGDLGSEKSKMSGLKGDGASEIIIDSAIATSSVKAAPSPKADTSGGTAATTSTPKATKTVVKSASSGVDQGAVQTIAANISNISGNLGSLNGQKAGKEAEIDS